MNITSQVQQVLTLEPNDPKSLATLCGQFDEHLRQIEQRLSVDIRNRGNLFEIRGETLAVNAAGAVLKSLYLEALEGVSLNSETIHLNLQQAGTDTLQDSSSITSSAVVPVTLIRTKKATIKPRGGKQTCHNICFEGM